MEEEERSKENKRSKGGGNMIKSKATVPRAWTPLVSPPCFKVASNRRGEDNDYNPLLCLYLQHEGQDIVPLMLFDTVQSSNA